MTSRTRKRPSELQGPKLQPLESIRLSLATHTKICYKSVPRPPRRLRTTRRSDRGQIPSRIQSRKWGYRASSNLNSWVGPQIDRAPPKYPLGKSNWTARLTWLTRIQIKTANFLKMKCTVLVAFKIKFIQKENSSTSKSIQSFWRGRLCPRMSLSAPSNWPRREGEEGLQR